MILFPKSFLIRPSKKRIAPDRSGRATLNSAYETSQMSSECDQQHRGKRKSDINNARRSLGKYCLANTPPAKQPNHSAGCEGEDQMKKQVSFKFRTFQLPLPRC